MAPDAPRIHDRIAQIYRSGVVHGVDDAPHSIMPASVTPERGRFLADLCRAENARATLEIGMAWGLSTLFILEALAENGALPRAHVVADPFQSSRWHGAALRSVREAGAAELVEFHEEPSEILLPRMASERRLFDFAFIDGNHRFDAVFVDMVFVSRLLKPGGLMVLDDAWFDPVYLACRFAETNLSYAPVAEFVAGKARGGKAGTVRPLMRAYRKPLQEVPRDVFHFVPFFDGVDDRGQRARERRLRNEGMTALTSGDRAAARRAFVGALRLNPRRLRTWSRLLRTFLPARTARATAATGHDGTRDPAQGS
jgi:predicted O-methyltransferase YrrM